MRAAPLWLSEADRRWLVGHRDSTDESELGQRAAIVLRAADGLRNVEIAHELGLSLPTVAKWRNRFADAGTAGLVDLPRSGRPRSVDHQQVVEATLRNPPSELGVSHWSSRLLAGHLGIGDATVARVWREYCFAPRPRGTYEFALSPMLVAGSVDVLGMYLTPRWRAAVLTLDEAPGTKAHRVPSRADGTRDTRPDGAVGRAPVDLPSGDPRIGEFLRQLGRAHPNRNLHVVAAGPSAPVAARTVTALGERALPCVHLVPSDQQWLRLVEVWFMMMARRSADGRAAYPIDKVRALVERGQSAAWIKRSPARPIAAASRWGGRRRQGWERAS